MQTESKILELTLPFRTSSRPRLPFAIHWILGALLGTAQCVHAAPANDQCSGAVSLAFGPFSYPTTHQMNTSSATATGDQLPICQASFDKGVWYYVTSRIDAVVMIDTCSSGFDTVLQAYTGNCGALTPMGCNDDNGSECAGTRASTYFRIAARQPYWILVGGLGGASGALNIRARLAQITPTVGSPYTRVSITNEAGNISAKFSLNYGDSCGMVKTWGTVLRNGTNIVADAECVHLLGYGCAAVVVTKTNTYQLGRLAPGQYTFHWRNFGSNILSAPFTVDPVPDTDGDGVSDADEAVADTNPNDANSVVRITAICPVPSGMRIDWQGGIFATQILQRASSSSPGGFVWTNIFTNRPPTATRTNYLDPVGAAMRLYRVLVER